MSHLRTVSAAFAKDADASYAVSLIVLSIGTDGARFARREVVDERGDAQMVILEATLTDVGDANRVETCMVGAYGVRIPSEARTPARSSWAS